MAKKMTTKLFTISQTAQALNISKDTLRRWDRTGYLKALRMGTRQDRRYRKEDILEIINKGQK